MSAFEYMLFSGGKDDEFVVHANKFTKAEAIELFKKKFDACCFRTPTESDIEERHVRYYVRVPGFCGYDSDGGCYTYASKNERGSFKVWVIKLKRKDGAT